MPYSLAGFVQATATTWVSLRGVWGRRECERSSGMRHSSPGKPIGTCAIPTQSRHNLDAISTQSRGISRQSEARRGNQWQSRGISRPSEARRGNQWQSEAIRGNRRQSEARRGYSEAISGNQRQLPCGTDASRHPRPPSSSPPAPNAPPRNYTPSGLTKPPDERGNPKR